MPTIEDYRHALAAGQAPGSLLTPLLRRVVDDASTGEANSDVYERWLTERLAGRGELERMLDQAGGEGRLEALLTASLGAWERGTAVTRLAERLDHVLRASAHVTRVPTHDGRELWAAADAEAPEPSSRTLRALLRSLDAPDEAPAPDELDDEALDAFVGRLLAVGGGALETGRIHDVLRHHNGFAPRVAAVAPINSDAIVPRRHHERPAHGRRGDIWLTAREGTGDALTVLLLDSGEDDGSEVWYQVLAVDDDLDAATWLHPILAPAETTLGVAQRVRLDREMPLRMSQLDVRIGQLTSAGRRTLTRIDLGLLPDERFGTPTVGRGRDTDADLDEDRALETLALADAEPEPDDDDDDGTGVGVLGEIDGGWSRRVYVAPGVIAVVDLLAGDEPPAAIFDEQGPQTRELAEYLRADDTAASAVRRLVVAEARASVRPHGLWVLDGALAATALFAALPLHLRDVASSLDRLQRRRATQAVRRLAALPAAVYHEGGAMLRGSLLEEVATLQEALAGTPELDTYEAWRRERTQRMVRDLNREERGRSSDRVPEFVLSGDPWARGIPLPLDVRRFGLTEREVMLIMRPSNGQVDIRLALRERILEALSAEPRDPERMAQLPDGMLPDIWVQLFDRATGEVLRSRLLELVEADSAISTHIERPPAHLGVAVQCAPARWIEVEALRMDGLLALPAERTWVARYLRSLAEDFTDPESRRSLLFAAEATAAVAVDPLAGSVQAGAEQRRCEWYPEADAPRLPTGSDTIVTTLLLHARAARDAIADRLLVLDDSTRATDLADLHALDDLLN